MGTATKRARDTLRLQRLRERAEGWLGKSSPRVSDMLPGDVQKLVHELSVYQVELETQNEELRHVEVQLAGALDLSRKLYDLAPVGHLTLDQEGVVREANLTTAGLLGLNRHELVKKRLSRFIMPGSQNEFYLHFRRVLRTAAKQQCEAQMRRLDGTEFTGHLESIAVAGGPGQPAQCLTDLSDVTRQRQAEAALQAREEQYRLLFELNPCPMWICDENTLEFLDVNQAAVRLYGWSREEMLRLTIKDIRPPEDVPELMRKMASQRGSRASWAGEWRHWKRDHTVFDVEVTISCIQFQGGEARLAMVQDITTRKHAEKALRISQQRLALAAGGTRMGLFEWDIATGKVLGTEQAARLLGLQTTTTTTLSLSYHYRDWAEHVHSKDLPPVEKELRRCMVKHIPYEAEYRVVWPDGSVHWLSSRGVFEYAARGQPERLLGITMDITPRKRAEEQLRQLNATLERRVAERTEELANSNERLRAIMDSALVGILTLDEHGKIESANPAALRIFGYAPDEILGRNISRLMASTHPRPCEDFLEHYPPAGEKQFLERGSQTLGRRKDGRVFPLDLALTKFTAQRRRQFVAMTRDITERKRLERELLDISERERQRIGNELHDGLGQHLHGLYYLASLLEKGLREDGSPRAAELGQLNKHLQEALDLTRGLAHGLQPVKPEPQSLMIALRELAERTQSLYHVDCGFRCPGAVFIHRQSAANHLYRIAQEAVNNAMKHAKPTRIGIQLEATRQTIFLQIHDNGVGIPKRPGRLPGMGLRIMRYRAEAIRGSLLVQKQPHGGTEVVCTVPRQALRHSDEDGK